MDFSDAKATFGLNCTATPTSTGATGTLLLGSYAQDTTLSYVNCVYAIRAILCDSSSTFALTWTSGSTAASTSFVAGAAQVETATIVAASGCTSNGTMALVVTAAGMTGSPKTVNVALTTTEHTTASLIAAAARTALAADTAVAALFTIGGTVAAITLTRKPTASYTVTGGTLSLYAANDATLNLAIPAGLGVTLAATSTNTTAGVVTSGVKIYDGDGNDLEGVPLLGGSKLRGLRIDVEDNLSSAYVTMTATGTTLKMAAGQTTQLATSDTTANNLQLASALSFIGSANSLAVTVIVATSNT